MIQSVCLFGASSDQMDPEYNEAAREFGRLLAQEGWTLVFGGGQHGMMGETAKGVHEGGGHVLGIIPEKLDAPHISYEASDEWIVTDSLRNRKALMEEKSDAYVVLPGGFGTLEEIMETMTLRQLGYHTKPMVILNTRGFYTKLFELFDHMIEETCVKPEHLGLYTVVETAKDAIQALREYNGE